MNKLTVAIIVLLYPISHNSFSQFNSEKNVVGINFSIQSHVLNEEREIQVYLPNDHETSGKKYPVMYLLDGQRFFLYGVSLLKSFTKFKQTPEFIVVGITNHYPDRFKHFSSGASIFLEFIENDIVNFIDKKFPTSGERMLFGWEYGGSFVIQSMLNRADLFDAYLAASPFPLQEKITVMDSLITKNTKFDKFLYFSVSENEGMVNDGVNQLDSLLRNRAPNTLNWKHEELEGEEHRSTPYPTIYHGIKSYYKYFPELQFNTLDDFKQSGGMSYVYDYYNYRAKRFGFTPELTDWTKFTLIRNAIRANDFIQFEAFNKEFLDDVFIGSLRGTRPYSIAEFYEKHNEYTKAIKIYEVLVNKYPDSEKPLNALGDLYTSLKDNKKAALYYRLASGLKKNN